VAGQIRRWQRILGMKRSATPNPFGKKSVAPVVVPDDKEE
jgi:hypothetical protein